MRCVLDTNILISGLISADGPPGRLLDAWIAGQFMLVSSEAQLREFRRASRYERVKPFIAASEAGALVNAIRATAVLIDRLPVIKLSPDTHDDYLLAMAKTAKAQYLVTGDKPDLLALTKIGSTRIVTAAEFVRECNIA